MTQLHSRRQPRREISVFSTTTDCGWPLPIGNHCVDERKGACAGVNRKDGNTQLRPWRRKETSRWGAQLSPLAIRL